CSTETDGQRGNESAGHVKSPIVPAIVQNGQLSYLVGTQYLARRHRLTVQVRLEDVRDEGVRRGGNTDFLADADHGAAQPRQLEPAAALEILEQRRLHVRRQRLV